MHGGGNAPTSLNDSQWENQKHLYQPAEGVYVCPRAPWDDWDMWFKNPIDKMFEELIQTMMLYYDVNPDKVYLIGYSAGGDGVWRMAPRMADTWAGASMMAGHPGDVSLLNLRNTPFMVWCGALDAAYNRNRECAQRGLELDSLHTADPNGYLHETHIVEGKPHWMDLEDAAALPWLQQYQRNPYPTQIVWRQEEVTHPHFYWLTVPEDQLQRGKTVRLSLKGNTVNISKQSKGTYCNWNVLENAGLTDNSLDIRSISLLNNNSSGEVRIYDMYIRVPDYGTGIKFIPSNNPTFKTRKFIQNEKIIIQKNGKYYNVMGQKQKNTNFATDKEI